MKSCYLSLEKGPITKTLYPLKEETTIGRSPDNTVSLEDPFVSRHHAKISCKDGVWSVEDLGSANGIMFAGNRVDKIALTGGDAFQIGETTFRFVEKDVKKGSDELFQTMEVMSSTIEVQDFLTEQGETESWKERIQKTMDTVPFFSCINRADHERLIDTGILYLLDAGESIIREGDLDPSIYIILEGRVRVFSKDSKGQDVDLAVLGQGEFFGETSFLYGKRSPSSVATLDTSVLIEFSHTHMREFMQEHPALKQASSESCQDPLADLEEKQHHRGHTQFYKIQS
jgi:pSer/pThr/pTyr-binding forkhead associated (FHA) protein